MDLLPAQHGEFVKEDGERVRLDRGACGGNLRSAANDLRRRVSRSQPRSLCRRPVHHPAYWFTASTSFANPAVTLARSLSDTFAGIAPHGVPAFIAAQLIGAILAIALASWLWGGATVKQSAPPVASREPA